MGAWPLRVTVMVLVMGLVTRSVMRVTTRGGAAGARRPSGLHVACTAFGARTCAVGEKGAMAGMVAEGVALALVTPTMRGLT